MESFLHRGLVPTSTHQPEMLVCSPAGAGVGWELRLGLREFRPHGEDWGWLCEDSLKGANAPQQARRESGKKSGPAKEATDHCFGVHKERGFLPPVPTEGRALTKRYPEMGVSCSYQLGPQRGAGNANSAAATTKSPLCKHRLLPTPSLGACAAHH